MSSALHFIGSLRLASTSASEDFLGIGDPRFQSLPAALGGALQELPDTALEVNEVAGLFGHRAKVLLGEQATEQALRAESLGRFGYLLFATHGLMRTGLPSLDEPAIVLTAGASGDPRADGLLTATEVAGLSLNVRLVVLSACDTAHFAYDAFHGEVGSIASAFAVAGAPATLATLWPVESATSREITTSTFRFLMADTDAPPAVALAKATRSYIRSSTGKAHAHPRFWAPFVVLGDGFAESPRRTSPAAPDRP